MKFKHLQQARAVCAYLNRTTDTTYIVVSILGGGWALEAIPASHVSHYAGYHEATSNLTGAEYV